MNRRDRAIGIVAALLVLALAGLIVLQLREARENGIEVRETLRLEQVEQLARGMNIRVEQAYTAIAGIYGRPGFFTMRPGDPADLARLEQNQSPTARTGSILVDPDGTITNGTLLSTAAVGDRLERPGLADALKDMTPAVLPVATGVTTSSPTLAVVTPLVDRAQQPVGAHIFEIEVTADSAFSEEIAGLDIGGGGVFSVVDQRGTVVASTDPSLLATRPDRPVYREPEPGFHRAESRVGASAGVPAAGWRLTFDQSISDFEGDLVEPLQSALLLLAVAAVVGGALSVVALVRRLTAARDEQRRLARINQEQEEFTSIVSHELRTPVTGVLGFLQTVLDHWEAMGDDERRAAVGRAATNAARLHALTRDVLDATSVETGQLQYHFDVVDLRNEVEAAVLAARDVDPERIIDIDLPQQETFVSADPVRIQQVLLNLLDNASANSPRDAPVRVSMRLDGDNATVAVSDQGPGISPDQVDRVFERFARGRPSATRGSGLGLYICRRIMEAHSGRIWVDQSDGRAGATIVFSLPLTSAAATVSS